MKKIKIYLKLIIFQDFKIKKFENQVEKSED